MKHTATLSPIFLSLFVLGLGVFALPVHADNPPASSGAEVKEAAPATDEKKSGDRGTRDKN